MTKDTAALSLVADPPVSPSGTGALTLGSDEPPPQSHHRGQATEELASIMHAATSATGSALVSSGSSSPPFDHRKDDQAFIPPARPSSTPFPKPGLGNEDIRCLSGPVNCVTAHPHQQQGDHVSDDSDQERRTSALASDHDHVTPPSQIRLVDLPVEIHECILDHVFGYHVSASSPSSSGVPNIPRSWAAAPRHARRRQLSALTLVSPVWRHLIQERLYRHIKLEASIRSINQSLHYFALHPHLRVHVRHIEIWFPVFEPKFGPASLSNTSTLPTVTADGLTNASYVIPANNCAIEEVLYFVGSTFPDVQVLTLEGGERKKAPQVRHFIRPSSNRSQVMPRVPSITTLICKGQWNLIRGDADFRHLMSAFPNLQHWYGSYSKPKSKSYLTMASVLTKFPLNLTSLHLCLEGDYRRELSFAPHFLKVSSQLHFCTELARAAAPALEHLSYTGRVCHAFFDLASQIASARSSRLKSIDLTVKNCCRNVVYWNESGSGITDLNFIRAFEVLVLSGIRSLAKIKSLEYLRIRYVDLDSPVPPLNPYFLLHDGWCSGVWSDAIVAELNRARPQARFEDLADSFGEVGYNKDGRLVLSPEFPRKRVLSLKLSNYAMLGGAVGVS